MEITRREFLALCSAMGAASWYEAATVPGQAQPFQAQETFPKEWQGQWIWQAEDGPANTWMCFRHSLDLPARVTNASAFIACADKYWLWINGELVLREGGLKSGPTRSDWYVDALDMEPYLRAGHNQIAVLVWFWGHDGASHRNAKQGGLFFELSAGKHNLFSNENWRLSPHPAYGQRGDGVSVTLPEQAVDFDARRDQPTWVTSDFDDTNWAKAAVKGTPPVAPWGKLVQRPIPFWRDSAERPFTDAGALKLPVTGPAQVVGHLPANLQVYPRFRLRAPAGALVKVHIERDKKTTLYTTREGEQEFEVLTWGNGHFVTYEIPADVELLEISYRETGYDVSFAGEFSCSDEALNKLWGKAARTSYLCMRDTFMDCPDRERSSWIGDVSNTIEVTLRTLDLRAGLMIGKTFRQLAGWATPEGVLWSAVPTSRFVNSFREFPAQTLTALGFGLRSCWLFRGGEALVPDFYPAFRQYIFNLWTVEDGVVQHRGPWETGWGAGVQVWYDWGTNIDAEALDQLLFFAALETLRLWSLYWANLGAAKHCREWQNAIRAAFDTRYWSEEVDAYRSPRHTGPPDERVQALAVLTGLAPASRSAAMADCIEKTENCSIYMEHLPLQALVKLGRPQSALARFKRRFAHEIASSYTTLPEVFGEDSNHAWGGAAVCLLGAALVGVEVLEMECRRVRFAPVSGGLDNAVYAFPAAQGNLRFKFQHGANGTDYEITVPKGVVVEARLDDKPQIKVNDQLWHRDQPCPFKELLLKDAPLDGVWLSLGTGHWQLRA